MTELTDDAMFKAIEKFQMDRGLNTDGVVRPEGETAQALNFIIQRIEEGKERKLPPKL